MHYHSGCDCCFNLEKTTHKKEKANIQQSHEKNKEKIPTITTSTMNVWIWIIIAAIVGGILGYLAYDIWYWNYK